MDLIFIITIPLFLWLFSLVLLSTWKHFFKFLLWNFLFTIAYFSIINFGGKYIFGHDEYGLKVFFSLIICVIIHVVIGFIFALYKNYQLRKDENTNQK